MASLSIECSPPGEHPQPHLHPHPRQMGQLAPQQRGPRPVRQSGAVQRRRCWPPPWWRCSRHSSATRKLQCFCVPDSFVVPAAAAAPSAAERRSAAAAHASNVTGHGRGGGAGTLHIAAAAKKRQCIFFPDSCCASVHSFCIVYKLSALKAPATRKPWLPRSLPGADAAAAAAAPCL